MAKNLTEAELKRRARKKKIRKRRFLLFMIFLLIAGIGVFYYLLQTKLFPVKKVAASGSKLYGAAEIVAASEISDKTPIMSVDEETVGAKLRKKLPYIEDVKITRNFPDAVRITVTDAKETFAFKSGKKYFVVSEKLNVLTSFGKIKKGLIEVKTKNAGVEEGKSVRFTDKEEKDLFELLYSYTKAKKIPLNAIDVSNRTNITVSVSKLYKVNLGSNVNIREKIDQLSVMIKEIGNRKGVINLGMWSKTDSKGTFIPEK